MSAASSDDDSDLWFSRTKNRMVRLSEMHGAHLLNSARQLLREAFDERRAAAETTEVVGVSDASIRSMREAAVRDGLWAWITVRSIYRADFEKLLNELRRRTDNQIEGSIRAYALHLDVRGYASS